MLGKSFASPVLTCNSAPFFCSPGVKLGRPAGILMPWLFLDFKNTQNSDFSKCSQDLPYDLLRGSYGCDSGSRRNNLVGYANSSTSIVTRGSNFLSKKWKLCSTATDKILLAEGEKKMWNDCRQALCAFKFSSEEEDKILGKAFGQLHSPYWYEERKKEVPKMEVVNEILDYLRSLSLSDDDLTKLVKKFPEVLGCGLEDEIKSNVEILSKQWGIQGKSLKNLLLRNPKVLGYNVDCKGDCEAKCSRCWARF